MDTDFPKNVLDRFARMKQTPVHREDILPLDWYGVAGATLVPVTIADAEDPEAIARFARWREIGAEGFPSQFPVTLEGTANWAKKGLMDVPDRVLFWVMDPSGTPVGHAGFYRLNVEERGIEIDNIVRGDRGKYPGIMHAAVKALDAFAFDELGLSILQLHVFADNERALRLYQNCGFMEVARSSMVKKVNGPVVAWVEEEEFQPRAVKRDFVCMKLQKAA